MFRIHRSNRTDRLEATLAGLLVEPAGDLFRDEVIVVQSRGMERWLSMRLATRLGAFGGARFPFPRAFVEEAFSLVLDGRPKDAARPAGAKPPFDREHLALSIARELPSLVAEWDGRLDDRFAPIRGFLRAGEPGEEVARRLELAERIAHVFDQYAVYRPDEVRAWERGRAAFAGDEGDWQPALFRAVRARLDDHVAARERAFHARLACLGVRPDGLPSRAFVFGVSALPPLYLRVLVALSRLIDVHLLLLAPTPTWVADLTTRRPPRARLVAVATVDAVHAVDDAADGATAAQPDAASALGGEVMAPGEPPPGDGDHAPPLFAALGRIVKDAQAQLASDEVMAGAHEDDRDLFEEPAGRTLLAAVQRDLFHVRARDAGPGERRTRVDRRDDSIQLHACHSPMREMEVLRDRLLDLFQRDPTLRPRDVIVMAPDIETYAPLIDAAFAATDGDDRALPYRVADRPLRRESPSVEAFLAALGLLSGRLRASSLLDLLCHEPVRRRFGLATGDVPRLREAVERAGLRWGEDAAAREREGQPPLDENTIRFGLRRMLLGYAIGGGANALFAGIAPLPLVEGEAAERVGRFVALCERVMAAREACAAPRPIAGWRDRLGALCDALLDDEEAEGEDVARVRESLATLAACAEAVGFDEPVPLEVVRRMATERLSEARAEHAFLSGGVTFCSLLPMRSVPFRVVCLVGMNEGDFPRAGRAPGFDRIAAQPRPGDRVLRDEDRHLFLEALLAARDHLVVTWVGRGVRDDRERPVSTVVAALLDAIEEGYALAGEGDASGSSVEPDAASERRAGRALRERLVVAHPLQPFSARYFQGGDDRLFTYAEDLAPAARRALGERAPPPPFVDGPLPLDGSALALVRLDDLARFFEQPARALVRARLGLRLGDDGAPPDLDHEPMELDKLAEHHLGTRLVDLRLAGVPEHDACSLLRARGELPLGALGRERFDELWPLASALADAAQALRRGERRSLSIDEVIELEGGERVRLVGSAPDAWDAGAVRHRFGTTKARDRLGAWVRHLALQLAAPAAPLRHGVLLACGRKEGVLVERLAPVDDPRAVLATLLALYRVGLRAPLPLFPASSWSYVDALEAATAKGASPDEAHERALQAAGRGFRRARDEAPPGDGDDPEVKQLFGDGDPLRAAARRWGDVVVPDFADASRAVLEPLRAHLSGAGDEAGEGEDDA